MESLVGKRFHRLLVLERVENKRFPSGGTQPQYKCLCDCGKQLTVLSGSLISENTKSCGCLKNESIAKIGRNNVIDIVGKTFGKLLVLRIDDSNDSIRIKWICKCECGNIVSVFGENLNTGNTSSCGCLRKESASAIGKSRIHDLLNHRFGKLLVLDLHGTDKENGALWKCLCDCGNIKIISTQNLSKGTISCGCARIDNLRNKIYGKLTVLNQNGFDKWGSAVWTCSCECGNTVDVSAGLLKGGQKSCGCLTESYLASELKKYFKKNKNAQVEKKLFKNPETNQWLRCDIYIPENIFIEVHGSQHYKIGGWHRLQAEKNMTTAEHEYNNQKHRDNLKKIFCEERGKYIEIDLRKFKTPMDAINYIENILKTLR